MAHHPLKLAVVGATGAIGRSIIEVLEEHEFPVAQLRLLASPRSAGTLLEFEGEELEVQALDEKALSGCELAIFAAGSAVSKEWIPKAWTLGCASVDLSPAFAGDESVPMVVPEVNPDDVARYRQRGVVVSPGAPVVPLAVVLAPLRGVGIERVSVSTYQAISGAGQTAVVQLEREAQALMNGLQPELVETRIPHRIAFNVVPQVGEFTASGYTRDELQLMEQTPRILGDRTIRISATCVQVPVFYGHAESVNVATRKKLAPEEVRELLRQAPGVKVVDGPGEGIYPMPMLTVNDDSVLVGRIREDRSQERGLELFLVADNLRKGAATNAVQIARLLQERELSRVA